VRSARSGEAVSNFKIAVVDFEPELSVGMIERPVIPFLVRVVPFIEVVERGDLLKYALTISGSSATLAVSRIFAAASHG
jgi:hypothetical protein